MKRIYILCEGQTEEKFVNDILSPYFFSYNTIVTPIIIATKNTVNKKFKGGIVSYNQIVKDLNILCKQHPHEIVTTMFDYYGLPNDVPYLNNNIQNIYDKVEYIEKNIENNLNLPNLLFYLNIHEFETLLFSDPQQFDTIATQEQIEKLINIKNEFGNIELINNSVNTAPSKRIIDIVPNYNKVLGGIIVAKNTGLNKMLEQCQHFREWVNKLLS